MNWIVECLRIDMAIDFAVTFMSTQKLRFEYWINPRSEYYFMEFITSNTETIISYNLETEIYEL